MRLKVVLELSDEGGYTVYVPSLPGCVSEGDTIDEAMANIGEAVMHLKADKKITNGEYQKLNEVSRSTAARELSALIERGIIERRAYWARHSTRTKGLKRLINDPMRTFGNDENNVREYKNG